MSRRILAKIGPVHIYPDRGRSKTEHMGRFGGGWQFRLGITASTLSRRGGTILVGLGIREYRLAWGSSVLS